MKEDGLYKSHAGTFTGIQVSCQYWAKLIGVGNTIITEGTGFPDILHRVVTFM